jgi:hypothetical protein
MRPVVSLCAPESENFNSYFNKVFNLPFKPNNFTEEDKLHSMSFSYYGCFYSGKTKDKKTEYRITVGGMTIGPFQYYDELRKALIQCERKTEMTVVVPPITSNDSGRSEGAKESGALKIKAKARPALVVPQ